MTTQLYSHDIHLQHITPPGHPERVDRLKVVSEALNDPVFDELQRKQSVIVDESLLELVHPVEFIEKIRSSMPDEGFATLAADTHISPDSWESVKYAVGASLAAVDAVFDKQADNAFVAIRPPGHHARRIDLDGCWRRFPVDGSGDDLHQVEEAGRRGLRR